MKRLLPAIVLLIALSFAPASHAQNHGQAGVFANYFRLQDTQTNFAGVGARVGFNISPYLQFESEMSYDFNQVFTESFTAPGTGTVTVQNSNIRVLHGLFGPKIQTGGPVTLFLVAKGGFINFRFDDRPVTFGTFFSSVDSLRSNNVSAVFYPGGGMEAYLGPIGLRVDIGDEMYFANGTHHNLRVSFGPTIRF